MPISLQKSAFDLFLRKDSRREKKNKLFFIYSLTSLTKVNNIHLVTHSCRKNHSETVGRMEGKLMHERIEITAETITRRRGVSKLARAVGRNHSHISRVLSGERKAGKALAKKLARLGVEVGA